MQGGNDSGVAGVRPGRSALLDSVLSSFRSRGYVIANYSDVRGCVDFVAVRGDTRFVVRVLSNVDALREESVEEFARLADLLSATPIIVGERTKRDALRDGLIYRRYGLPVVTPYTLERILDGEYPKSEVYNGRILVYFDVNAFRAARQALGLSQNELASRVGATKDSIYRYEHGYPALEPVARRILEVLGEDILAPVSLYSRDREESPTGIFSFRRAPWDIFVASAKRVALSSARGVVRRKIELLKRGKDVVHDYYAVVVSGRVRVSLPEDVPTIPEDDIREAKPKEILRRVEEELE